MHDITRLALFILLLPNGLPAQSAEVSAAERMLADMEVRFAAFEREKEHTEQWRKKMFEKRAQKFVRLWNAFVDDYNQGIVDVHKMREVSKAFRQLEKAGGWPAAERSKKGRAKPSSPNGLRTQPRTASPPGDTAGAP